MSSPVGFALPALAIGLGALYIKPKRGFFFAAESGVPAKSLTPQVTIEEVHHDDLEITEHPVERGAAIGDHAFKATSRGNHSLCLVKQPSP